MSIEPRENRRPDSTSAMAIVYACVLRRAVIFSSVGAGSTVVVLFLSRVAERFRHKHRDNDYDDAGRSPHG